MILMISKLNEDWIAAKTKIDQIIKFENWSLLTVSDGLVKLDIKYVR